LEKGKRMARNLSSVMRQMKKADTSEDSQQRKPAA
jgi:hypothetical protein